MRRVADCRRRANVAHWFSAVGDYMRGVGECMSAVADCCNLQQKTKPYAGKFDYGCIPTVAGAIACLSILTVRPSRAIGCLLFFGPSSDLSSRERR